MNFFGLSNPGLKRSNNEDAFIINPDPGFCALADGMGGAAAGELASRLFVETAYDVFSKKGELSEQKMIDLVQTVFRLANRKILDNAMENPDHKGMGCTAELLAFYDQNIILGHVGDSRTYLFRGGVLRKLTRDHSLIQEQLEQGLITQDEAKKHSLRHVILRAVGVKDELEIDLIRGKALEGDLFLLCSDGLTDMIDEGPIKEVLLLLPDLPQKAERLIKLANSAGGFDNITVVLCQIP